ncbi:MAG: hypothetical protein HFG09_02730 [Oscillibacter sp.]|nr:hypothetical protein [Oscillibacter sp.]
MKTEKRADARGSGRVLRRAGWLLFTVLVAAGILWMMRPVPRPAAESAAQGLIQGVLAAGRGLLFPRGGMFRQMVRGLIAAEIWALVLLPLWTVAASWLWGVLFSS